ncbi:hypothetical protein Tco_0291397 [Tanacetum coccineum]
MKIPMSSDTKLTKDKECESMDSTKYRCMIGSLLHLTASRPDIMFSVCLCARFQEDPKTSHLEAVKRIFQYIKGTTHLGLWYPKGTGIETVVYADSDHAGDYVESLEWEGMRRWERIEMDGRSEDEGVKRRMGSNRRRKSEGRKMRDETGKEKWGKGEGTGENKRRRREKEKGTKRRRREKARGEEKERRRKAGKEEMGRRRKGEGGEKRRAKGREGIARKKLGGGVKGRRRGEEGKEEREGIE